MFILDEFKDRISEILEKRIKEIYSLDYKVHLVEPPENMGDVSFQLFELSKILKKDPVSIGRSIIENLKIENIEKIEQVGPYINMYFNFKNLSYIYFQKLISEDKQIFQFPEKNKKVILEHTSANPTGPLHVGRGRNPIIGDSLKRILKKYGYNVETHYFVNDAGRQSSTLVWGVKNFGKHEDGKTDHVYVKFYQMANEIVEKDKEKGKEIDELMRKIESGDKETLEFSRTVVCKVLDGILETLAKMDIRFDSVVYETEFIINGMVQEVIEKLKTYLKDENGALYFPLNDEKIYLTRSDGTSLYFTRDIAYHLYKRKLGDLIINVLGEDHKAHADSLLKVLKKIDENIKIENVFYSFVSLPEGKMSTRRGRVVYLDDLLNESIEKARIEIEKRRNDLNKEKIDELSKKIGIGAVKFNIIKIQSEKPLVFKWEEALNFEGDSLPFLQYSYARASSILKKMVWKKEFYPENIDHPREIALIKLLLKYTEILKDSAESLKPYKVAKYGVDLASEFNLFYSECPVLRSEGKTRENRLALVHAFRETMGDLLETLGIDHPEEM